MARNVKRFGSALSQTTRPIVDTGVMDAKSLDGLSDFVAGMQQMALKNEKTGIGTTRDQRTYTDYVPTGFINRVVLESIFNNSWLGNRIISTLPEDMIRPWRRCTWDGIKDDDQNVKAITKYERKVKAKKRLLTGSKWSRLYGGALLIPVLKSQPDEVLAEPLDYESIEKDDLVAIHVFDRWRCAHDGTLINDALNPQNGMPEHYRLAESSVRLHHTRVIRLDGRELPYFNWRANSMWNVSVLQILINNLKQYDTAVAAITQMMFQMNVDIIMQSGLRAALSTKDGGAKALERFRQFALNKSFNGVGVLDKDTEEYQRHPYTFGGVDTAFDKVMYDVCGAADVPFTRLFGQSPAGMNATGESDDRHYYNHVASRREEHLDDPLAQLDEFLVRSALGHMPDGYESTWNDAWQATEAEQAQTEYTRAQTRALDLQSGAIDEGIIAQDLYDRRVYKGMTQTHVKNAARVAKSNQALTEAAMASGGDPSLTLSGRKTVSLTPKKPEQNQAPTDGEDDDEGGEK